MNLFLIAVLLVLLWKITEGYKRGMVKEIISFVSLVVLCVVVVLIGSGFRSYTEKEYVGVIVAAILLCILGIAHHLLGVVFFSAKLISKLPVAHWIDKVLGVAAGILETVLVLWTVYGFIEMFGLGMLGQQILAYTEDSEILSWLHQYNYLLKWVTGLGSRFI